MKVKEVHPKKQVKFKLKNSKSKYFINTAPTDPKLPGLFVFCGSRGSGKTYACVAMCSHFEKKHYIHNENIFDLSNESIQQHFPESKNLR